MGRETVASIGIMFILLFLPQVLSVLTILLTLAAPSELVLELLHGHYTLGALISTSILLVMTISDIRAKVTIDASNREGAASAMYAMLFVNTLLFTSIYLLQLGIPLLQTFMNLYIAVLPIWIVVYIVDTILWSLVILAK